MLESLYRHWESKRHIKLSIETMYAGAIRYCVGYAFRFRQKSTAIIVLGCVHMLDMFLGMVFDTNLGYHHLAKR